jgi:hypothetical protein
MHMLLAVCQRLDEPTRQCEDWQEKILELMLSLSIGIDEKLRATLETTNSTLESTRALICESQRPQRYSQYCEDPETRGKGKGREETPRTIPTLGRHYPLEYTQPQGRFASRTASEGTIEYSRQLERDAKDIFFPPDEEEMGEKRHHLEIKRKLDNCQRYS